MPKEITDPELTNVEVVKTVTDESGDGFVTPGELLTYTLNISNLGKMFQDDVTITDDIVDPNLDLSTAKIIQAQVSGSDITPVVTTNGTKVMVNMGTIHNASTGKLVFTIKAKDTFTSAKTISNTASVTSLVHQDPFNSSTATIDVDTTGLNDLLVTKTVEDSTTSTNDGVIDEPNGYAGLEEVLHYNVNIENNGLRAATGIIVTDDMDDPELNDATLTNVVVKYGDQVLVEDTGDGLGDYSVRYGDALTVITNLAYELPVGKSLDISFDITTKVDSLESGLVENTVFVKADDMADASGFASIPRDLSDAKLSINKTVTEGSFGTVVNVDNYATPGEELRYKITLKNIGTTPITDVTITDSLDTTKFDMTKGVYNLVYTDKDGLAHTNLTPSSTYLLSTDLASNDVATLEFSVDLLPTFDGSFNTVKNTATA